MNNSITVFKDPPVLVQFLIAIPSLIIGGYFILLYWKWFAVPLGAPAITIAHAIGLDVLVSSFVSRSSHEDIRGKFWEKLIEASANAIVLWLIAFVAHMFM